MRLGYLTCVEDRGTLINDFVHMVMHYGAGVMRMLADDTVSRLTKAVRALKQESHKYTGFVRFSISEDNTLTSIIEPKIPSCLCSRRISATDIRTNRFSYMTRPIRRRSSGITGRK